MELGGTKVPCIIYYLQCKKSKWIFGNVLYVLMSAKTYGKLLANESKP